jgi:hypothetical protein
LNGAIIVPLLCIPSNDACVFSCPAEASSEGESSDNEEIVPKKKVRKSKTKVPASKSVAEAKQDQPVTEGGVAGDSDDKQPEPKAAPKPKKQKQKQDVAFTDGGMDNTSDSEDDLPLLQRLTS